jgi:hypothetical protein
MSTWLTQQDMKRDTGKERNRAFWEPSTSRGHAQQGLADAATLTVGLWEQAFATSTAWDGTPKHRYPHPSFKYNAHYTPAKWDEKTKG